VLEDAAGSISRQHAELSSSQGAWYVRDLASRNGTILNTKRLAENQPTKLTTNCQLQIGAWVMRVQVGDAEPLRDSSHATLVQTLSDTDAGSGVFERVASQPLAHLASHRLATLLECSETIHASKDLHEAGQAAIHAMLESTGYARGAFVRMGPESGVIETLAFDSRTPGEDVSSVRFSQSLLDMASGGEVIRLSTTGTQRDYGQSIAELDIHSAICIPVMNSDEPIGFLYLDARGAEHGVSQDASSFGRGVARLLALTDANLRSKELEIKQLSMQYDLDIAGNAQRLLLPPAQGEVGSVEYCVSMRPGRFVAGDLFGVVPLDDGRVCVFLGDVSGKGAGSAILMATTQSYIHAMLEQTTDLTRVLTKLNRHVSERSYHGMFVTMWIGILSRSADGHRCDVEFIDAGHGHWLLTRPDQDALCPTFDGGMVVGIAPDYQYSTERLTLEGDQRLVLFSDGVIEQTPPSSSDEFGLERT
jgi:sigma-B regulation protein RsbU (phosphoserine phosphatase)